MGNSRLWGNDMKINEIFYSLEGEGAWQGYPTIFIRFAGCNLNCDWCDTDHTCHEKMDIQKVLMELEKYPCRRIKITGGEPLVQNVKLPFLIKVLKDNGYLVALETNGTLFEWICFSRVDLICMDIKPPSSKEESVFNVITRTYKEFRDKTEFKIVISDLKDLLFAESYALLSDIILMPNSRNGFDKRIIEEMKTRFPESRFGLRLHEVLDIK
jgi:7-carboxy-7-deazaguanine synthase